jgi:hypothetical protein
MGGERTGKGVSGRGSVALMELGERAHFAQLFESILLTSERLFGSLFLCSRRKTSIRRARTICFGSA